MLIPLLQTVCLSSSQEVVGWLILFFLMKEVKSFLETIVQKHKGSSINKEADEWILPRQLMMPPTRKRNTKQEHWSLTDILGVWTNETGTLPNNMSPNLEGPGP